MILAFGELSFVEVTPLNEKTKLTTSKKQVYLGSQNGYNLILFKEPARNYSWILNTKLD